MTIAALPEHDKLFRFWLKQGYEFRLATSKDMQADPQAYKDRMKMEYDVISSVPGMIDYFLMVSDIVRWAKDNGILVGPGRGSAAGSLCCYLLRITEIDPLLYPMLFERFISPDRPDLPDVDIDFEDERRHEVIEYAQAKYGEDRVANILNFVRYKGANSLKDIATVYRIPEWKVNQIKDKLVERPEGHPRFSDTLEDTFDTFDDLAALVDENPELRLASKLEGNYRHSSIHPCGIVVAGCPLNNVTATYTKESGKDHGSGIAYDKKDSEHLGLLKIDFLSLTTLTGIRATLEAIGMTIAEFYQIPLDDPKVYEAFRKCDVLGIFQFEGMATRRVLKSVAPVRFMDIVDVNALSRPGGDDKAYLENKAAGNLGLAENHEILHEHLAWTHGTIVYQEQILLLLRDLGNFPPEAVNSIRKIISAKKDVSTLEEFAAKFAESCVSHGLSEEEAHGIWQQMLAATGYAFNISHAVCYSDTAYRQMWLKIYYPEFYLGQLQKCPDDEKGLERRRKLIAEAKRHGVDVRPPNLNVSEQNWALKDGSVYAGFTAIKGIGPKVADSIVNWRNSRIRGYVGLDLEDMRWLQGIAVDIEWDELLCIPGIGEGRIQTIKDFVEHHDPFGLGRTQRILDSLRKDFENDQMPGVPYPTHRSVDLTQPDEFVTFMGLVKERQYKDVVEQRLKYGGGDQTADEILAELDYPHLRKYVTLTCEDEFDEPVKVRVSRRKYPEYERLVSRARLNKDVVVVSGYMSEFGGTAIQTKELLVIRVEEE